MTQMKNSGEWTRGCTLYSEQLSLQLNHLGVASLQVTFYTDRKTLSI